jgi:hypothetical protein
MACVGIALMRCRVFRAYLRASTAPDESLVKVELPAAKVLDRSLVPDPQPSDSLPQMLHNHGRRPKRSIATGHGDAPNKR